MRSVLRSIELPSSLSSVPINPLNQLIQTIAADSDKLQLVPDDPKIGCIF